MIETIVIAAISAGATWVVGKGLPIKADNQTHTATLTDSNIEYYKNLHEDIVIESLDPEDETEEKRFKHDQAMIQKHNKFAVNVHMIEFKDLKNRQENWSCYQQRLQAEKIRIKKERLEKICQDEVYYKQVGRKIARELYPANK